MIERLYQDIEIRDMGKFTLGVTISTATSVAEQMLNRLQSRVTDWLDMLSDNSFTAPPTRPDNQKIKQDDDEWWEKIDHEYGVVYRAIGTTTERSLEIASCALQVECWISYSIRQQLVADQSIR